MRVAARLKAEGKEDSKVTEGGIGYTLSWFSSNQLIETETVFSKSELNRATDFMVLN